MAAGLLIVDVQNDYFSGGKMELVGMEAACKNIRQLLSLFRASNLPVIFIQHISVRPNATFFLPGTKGAEIHQSILPIGSEPVFVKHFPNSFRETGLLEYLRKQQLNELVICGAMSHMCIDTTTRAAFDLGYACTVVADACATRDLAYDGQTISDNNVQLAYMAALNGTFARVTETKSIVDQYK